MKTICFPLWILSLSGLLMPAQTNEPVLKLAGIISLPGFKRVLLESPGPPRGEGLVTLSEGERRGSVELLAINNRDASVEVLHGGRKATLRFEDERAVSATETAGPNLRLSNADLANVFDVYAAISGRTVLQHPALKATPLSMKAVAKTKTEAVVVFEQLFRQHGLALIPDGSKFVMIVPLSLTNTVSARSSAIASKATVTTPSGAIDFQNADLQQVIAIYGRMVGRELVQPQGLRAATIRLRTVTDLTTAEAVYALETLFLWNGVKIIPLGEREFRMVPVSPPER